LEVVHFQIFFYLIRVILSLMKQYCTKCWLKSAKLWFYKTKDTCPQKWTVGCYVN